MSKKETGVSSPSATDESNKISVRVVSYDKAFDETGEYVSYVVSVTVGNYSWEVRRRYAAFSKFYGRIKPDCKDVTFPGKSLSKLNEAATQTRMRKLDKFMQQLVSIIRPSSVQTPLNEFLDCSVDVKRSRTFWKCMRQNSTPVTASTPKPREDIERIEKVKDHGSMLTYVILLVIACFALLVVLPYYMSLTLVWFGIGVTSALYLQKNGFNILADRK